MGPFSALVCHEHGTTWLPVVGPGSASGGTTSAWLVRFRLLGRCVGRMSYREVSVMEVKEILRLGTVR
jgi:hypothetical protein